MPPDVIREILSLPWLTKSVWAVTVPGAAFSAKLTPIVVMVDTLKGALGAAAALKRGDLGGAAAAVL